MQNRLNTFITNIGVNAVNALNYFNKTWGRIAPALTMDLYSLDKFKKYKKDWNYPVLVRHQEKLTPDKKCNTFQSAIELTLTVGQCFGLCPVLGIRAKDASKLRFKIASWRCAFTFLTFVLQVILVSLLYLSVFKESSSSIIGSAAAVIFYSLGFLITILFVRIASNWPNLCMEIAKMEAVDPNTDTKLRRKFNTYCIVILLLALAEHGFSELHGFSMAMDCEPERPLYETFVRNSFEWVFIYIPYNDFIGFMAHFCNIQCTFNWNFTDLFVICMSTYLTSRLEQVNKRVVAAKDKNSPSSVWRTMREDYNRTVHLVRKVDSIIGSVVFISFASNLFFVCSQLLHTLGNILKEGNDCARLTVTTSPPDLYVAVNWNSAQKIGSIATFFTMEGIRASPKCRPDSADDRRILKGYEHSIYFTYSFIFLVGRALTVSLTAARVHAASLKPAHSLYDVPSSSYCIEIERFIDQIHGDTVALSGLQFFHVKRGIVLTIAGTIVTYELVLMQFTGITPATSEPL